MSSQSNTTDTKAKSFKLGQEIIDRVNSWSDSFLRPHVPPKLLDNSEITGVEDDGAKLIYAKFYYGEQLGTVKSIPFDGSYGNVITDMNNESLWIYSLENEAIPNGFDAKSLKGGIIRTGKVRKCGNCRGHGQVRCRTCGGKIRWTERHGDRLVEQVCSCGNGKQMCGICAGYGDVETVVETSKSFKLYNTKNSQYKGEVPEEKIKGITGKKIYEQTFEYPFEEVKEMLIGGINVAEYNRLNGHVLNLLHESIDTNLGNKDVNTELIHSQVDELFQAVPNPTVDNQLMEREVLPIRVMVGVEDAPVKQIDYQFNLQDYSIWVFGNENAIWYKSVPFSFNYKMITLSSIALLGIGYGLLSYFGVL